MQCSFRRNQQTPFLRFPGEIRNKIYRYAFDKAIEFYIDHRGRSSIKTAVQNRLSLLTVCRIICAESRMFPFVGPISTQLSIPQCPEMMRSGTFLRTVEKNCPF
ncbi:hypothetical protein DPSP01_004850 [Paraphaeosphaeria sporulosa]